MPSAGSCRKSSGTSRNYTSGFSAQRGNHQCHSLHSEAPKTVMCTLWHTPPRKHTHTSFNTKKACPYTKHILLETIPKYDLSSYPSSQQSGTWSPRLPPIQNLEGLHKFVDSNNNFVEKWQNISSYWEQYWTISFTFAHVHSLQSDANMVITFGMVLQLLILSVISSFFQTNFRNCNYFHTVNIKHYQWWWCWWHC